MDDPNLKKRVGEISLLLEALRSAGGRINAAVANLLKIAADAFGADETFICELSGEEYKLVFYNRADNAVRSNAAEDLDCVPNVRPDKKPWRVTRTSVDDAANCPEMRERLKARGIRSVLWVSFVKANRSLGYIGALNPSGKGSGELAEALARMTALVLNRRDGWADLYRFRNFFDVFPGAVFTITAGKDRKLIRANRMTYKMLGYTREQIDAELDGRLRRVVAPEDAERVVKAVDRLSEKSGMTVQSFRMIRRDGASLWVQCGYILARDENGRPEINIVGFDISESRRVEQKLKESEERFRLAIGQIGANVWEVDVCSKTLYQTELSRSLNDLPAVIPGLPEALIECGFIHPDDTEAYLDMMRQMFSGRSSVAVYRVKTKDGDFRWQKVTFKTVCDKNGKPARAIALAEDLTETARQEERYRDELEMSQAVSRDLYATYKINFTTDTIENCKADEGRIKELIGARNFEQLYKAGADKLVNDEERKRYLELFEYNHIVNSYRDGKNSLTAEYRRVDARGRVAWVSTTVNIMREPKTGDLVGFVYIRDIDERKKLELALRERASRDPLTGLYTKDTLESMIGDSLGANATRGSRCALLMIDLDNFKCVNDSLGHRFGDQAITDIADTLTAAFDAQAVIGRVGGDEFVVFLREIESKDAVCAKADKLVKALSRNYKLGDDLVHVSASVGIVIAEAEKTNYAELFERADRTLYDVKDGGKNGYAVYGAAMNVERLRKGRDPFSKERLLDEFDDCILILDAVGGELFYLNKYGREVCQPDERDRLISFCRRLIPVDTSGSMFADARFSEQPGEDLMTRYKPILWNGLKAYIFILHPFDDLRGDCPIRNTRNDLLVLLSKIACERDGDALVDTIAAYIGTFYGADRVHVVAYDGRRQRFVDIREWVGEGVPPVRERLADITPEIMPSWKNAIGFDKPYIMADVESIREERPDEYAYLVSIGVKGYMTVADRVLDYMRVFVSVNNPTVNRGDLSVLTMFLPLVSRELSGVLRQKLYDNLQARDGLTGLLGRDAYFEYMSGFVPESVNTLGLAYADIDGLREYNAAHGPGEGDALIKQVADALRTAFPGAKVFRLVSDEFLVIEEDVSHGRFSEEVRLLRKSLTSVRASVSVGCVWERQNLAVETLVGQAEELMRAEKRESGRKPGTRVSAGGMAQKVQADLDRRLFRLYLQPMADAETGKIVGAESLVRYVVPGRGVIPPGKFIPEIEQAGCIALIDLFMFEQAAALVGRWRAAGLKPIQISVNFSRKTMLEPKLVPRIAGICRACGADPSDVEIEVTETLGEMNRDTLIRIGQTLRQAGFGLSLDDFGSKYSSMSILSAMDFDTVKIDKSIVDSVTTHVKARATVELVTEFCHKTGMQVVAEGVETAEQAAALGSLSCDVLQGYYFNKPLPVETFEKRYAQVMGALPKGEGV